MAKIRECINPQSTNESRTHQGKRFNIIVFSFPPVFYLCPIIDGFIQKLCFWCKTHPKHSLTCTLTRFITTVCMNIQVFDLARYLFMWIICNVIVWLLAVHRRLCIKIWICLPVFSVHMELLQSTILQAATIESSATKAIAPLG